MGRELVFPITPTNVADSLVKPATTTLDRAALAYRELLLAEASDALVSLEIDAARLRKMLEPRTVVSSEAKADELEDDSKVGSSVEAADLDMLDYKISMLRRRLDVSHDNVAGPWPAIFLLERVLLETISGRRLERRAWAIRNRYREVAGETKYALYTATLPQIREGHHVDSEWLRADLLELYRELEREYVFADALEQQRAAMSKAVAVLTVSIFAVLITLLTVAAISPTYRGWSIVLVFVAAAVWVFGANRLRSGKWRRA